MRPLTAEDEATLRAIAERHGFYAARGPHTGEGSASRLIDALLAGEVVTLALTPADRRRLVASSPGSMRRCRPTDALPPSCTAWPRNCARPSPKWRRQRRRPPPPSRRRHPPKRVPATSRPTMPPAVWT